MILEATKIFAALGQLALAGLIAHGLTSCPSPPQLLANDIIKKNRDGNYSWPIYEQRQLEPEQLMGWINNDTVLVVGHRYREGNGLYAWNPGSQPRMILKDGYRFCYDGKTWTALTATKRPGQTSLDYIRHQIDPVSLAITRLGPKRILKGQSSPSYYSCNDERRPAILDERTWERLRPDDGYLDLGPTIATGQETTIRRLDGTIRQDTPMRFFDSWNVTANYGEYAGAYLIYNLKITDDMLDQWRADNKFKIWLMEPDGESRAIQLPAGPWSAGESADRMFALSHLGMLVSTKGLLGENIKYAGIYLLRNDKSYTKLFAGSSQLLSVSPNGCRAAWAVTRPRLHSTGSNTHVVAADLCQSGNRNPDGSSRS